MPVRILLVHNHYQQPGGEDESFAAEAGMLRRAGHDVIEYRQHNDAIREMPALSLLAKTYWNRAVYSDLRKLIQQRRPEVAHFNNTFPLISPSAYYAARDENVPTVQALRNFRLLCPGATFHRNGKVCQSCLGKAVAWPAAVHGCYRGSHLASSIVAGMLAVHRAAGTWRNAIDLYFTPTEFARRKFIEGGIDPSRVVAKPNFVPHDPGVGSGAGRYGVFVGRLAPEKGLHGLLAAWRLLGQSGHRIDLKVIGDGPLGASLRAQDGAGGIQWLGRRRQQDVFDIMGQAKFLVFSSEWYETFGRVVIEAFAKGTPVIASNLGAMAEIVEHERTGLLFEPGNAAALADAVRRLLADPLLLARMRVEARVEYQTKYMPDQNYMMLMGIYGKAIGMHQQPRVNAVVQRDGLPDGIGPSLPLERACEPAEM